jgi:hypothetical protein
MERYKLVKRYCKNISGSCFKTGKGDKNEIWFSRSFIITPSTGSIE